MQSNPTHEPTRATANDTLTWQRALCHYPPADGWVLTYSLRGPASLNITADASEPEFQVTAKAPSIAGDYFLQGYVTLGDQRFTIYTGTLTLTPDLSAVTGSGSYDGRSPVKKILDAIDAAIANRASRTEQEYEIDFGGTRRRLKSVPIEDLLKARGTYALKYWRELNPGKIAPAVNVSFKGRY